MPRAVWTGSLSFGLVSIPVALYPATQPKDVRFHLFDRQGRRVRYRRVAEDPDPSPGSTRPRTIDDITASQPPPDETVDAARSETPHDDGETGSQPDLAYGDLLRGYEVEPGRFAMLEPEEIEQIRPAAQLDDRTRRLRRTRRHRPSVLREVLLPEPTGRCRQAVFPPPAGARAHASGRDRSLRAQDETASRRRPHARSCARPRDAVLRGRGTFAVRRRAPRRRRRLGP